MAFKTKIINVEQNMDTVVIGYQILNDSNEIVADAQTLEISDPMNTTLSKVKGMLLEKTKKIQGASAIAISWAQFINQVIEVD